MTKMLTFNRLLPALLFAFGCYASFAQTPCSTNPAAIICDDFESYDLGNLSPQSVWWTPWDLNDGSAVSAEVSSTFAYNGTKSMKVKPDGAGDDQLLNLANKSSGRYELKWKMYVPVGNGAYFNVQTDQDHPGASNANFSAQVYFLETGAYRCDLPTPTITGNYPQGVWFEVKLTVDLDNNLAKLLINGNVTRIWTYTQDFGAIDFYSNGTTNTFYVDQVEYVSLPPVVYNVDRCDGAIDLYSYFAGAPDVPKTTGIYNNTSATADPNDPAVTCWGEDFSGSTDIINGSMWYTFTGTGDKYHIETVPCGATNYIGSHQGETGDTQMLIYEGSNCADLTEVACNDDLFPDGIPDWRSAVDLQTKPGHDYYMMIDGFDLFNIVATGQFCIQVTKASGVPCTASVMGTYEVPNPYLCFEGQLADLFQVEKDSFVVPEEGLVSGFAWAFTSTPIPAGIWPSDFSGYQSQSPLLEAPYAPAYINTGPPALGFAEYYLTPVIVGGGALIDPTKDKTFENIDPSNGCFFVGAATKVYFLPPLNEITAVVSTNNGFIDLIPGGGLPEVVINGPGSLYSYLWSNGATTEDLQGVQTGTYTCTVTDQSGCSSEAMVTVHFFLETKDPAAVQSLTVSPNPTTGAATINLALASVSDVRIEVLNTLGQSIQNLIVGKVASLSQSLDLSALAQSTYFLRVTVDGETAMRRVVLQR